MPVTATIYAGVKARHTGTADLGTPFIEIDTGRKTVEFLSGTTAGLNGSGSASSTYRIVLLGRSV